jgi:L-2-hydroxyglutarate oxidase LhgO
VSAQGRTPDWLIVGAGIVGLTTALELGRRHPAARILVLEKEDRLGRHASGRNSGVLHCGIFYAPGTLKARVCAEGAARMRAFAAEHGIPCRRDGKVIVATRDQDLPGIDRLLANAAAAGVRAERLDEARVRALEPHATPHRAGIHCPDTAVIDAGAVLERLRALLAARGVEVRFASAVKAIDPAARTVRTGSETQAFGFLVNCAGAHADTLAHACGLARDLALVPFKGIYHRLRPGRETLVRGSIYPVPDPVLPFLGVHLTRAISGEVYAGPTAIPALGRENYGALAGASLGESWEVLRRIAALYARDDHGFRRLVHAEVGRTFKPWFLAAARRLVREIESRDLVPSHKVGIRAQLVNLRTRRLEMDYVIERTEHSLHVLNAISPAFTTSLAFAERLADVAEGRAASV